MSIRIEITGENTQEIAQSILQMAFMIAPRLAGQASQQQAGEAVATVAETVQPAKKPARAKKADAPTIEHDESEVKTDAVHGSGDQPNSGSGDRVLPDAPAEDAAGQTETVVAEVAAEPALTIDQLRAFTINEYLNTVFEKQEDRKNAYGALLERFQIKAITALPVEKINEFKAAVEAKIAEALAAK